jgi:hypothetical protein
VDLSESSGETSAEPSLGQEWIIAPS